MTLTTVSEQGVPQNSAVYVYFDEKMHGYCVTRESSRKYKNVSNNGVAVLSVYDENTLMFGELLCEAQILTENTKVMVELQKIVASRKSAYWVPPVSQLEGDRYVYIEFTPKRATFVNYEKSSSDNPHPYKVNFEIT